MNERMFSFFFCFRIDYVATMMAADFQAARTLFLTLAVVVMMANSLTVLLMYLAWRSWRSGVLHKLARVVWTCLVVPVSLALVCVALAAGGYMAAAATHTWATTRSHEHALEEALLTIEQWSMLLQRALRALQ